MGPRRSAAECVASNRIAVSAASFSNESVKRAPGSTATLLRAGL